MTMQVYKEYLHDQWEEIEWYFQDQGLTISEDVRSKMGRPFYEVCVTTEIDDVTGEVWVTHFDGVELVSPKKMN